MTVWTIDNLALTSAFVTAEKINTPWVNSTHNIYGKHGIVNTPNKQAQSVVFNINLHSTNRFAMESSIRAELEESPTVYVASTEDYVYNNNKFCWFVPTGMNITDGGAEKPLKCIISGLIDERTIHSCDFTTDWTGTTLTTSTSTRFGASSIKDTASTNTDHFTTYTPPTALDLSAAHRLCCWIKASQASAWFDTIRMEILTNSYYDAWDVTTFSADTWSYQTYDLTTPDETSGTISSDNITSIRLRTNPPSVTSYDVYLAWIWVE